MVIVVVATSSSSAPTSNVSNTPVAPPANVSQRVIQPTVQPQTQPEQDNLSNSNYYVNSNGNAIHSPAYSNSGVPAGATAQCRDGTYSFSQHRSGTCSYHGGVATWL